LTRSGEIGIQIIKCIFSGAAFEQNNTLFPNAAVHHLQTRAKQKMSYWSEPTAGTTDSWRLHKLRTQLAPSRPRRTNVGCSQFCSLQADHGCEVAPGKNTDESKNLIPANFFDWVIQCKRI
jgi:hypothetical protein